MPHVYWQIFCIQFDSHHINPTGYVLTLQIYCCHPLYLVILPPGKHFLRCAELQPFFGLHLHKH